MFLHDVCLQIFCGNWNMTRSSVCVQLCDLVHFWCRLQKKSSYKMVYGYLTVPLRSFVLTKCQSLRPSWSTGRKIGFHLWQLVEINIRKCPDILLTCLIILINTQLIALQKKQGIAQCQTGSYSARWTILRSDWEYIGRNKLHVKLG